MGVLANPFTRTAVILVSLSGCVAGGTSGPAPVRTPGEAATTTGALVGGFGAAACQFIEDRTARNACFTAVSAAAVAAASEARARAATAGSCDEYDRRRRSAEVDNTTGRTTRDRTTHDRDIECSRRLPNNGNRGIQPIFE